MLKLFGHCLEGRFEGGEGKGMTLVVGSGVTKFISADTPHKRSTYLLYQSHIM